MKKTLLLASIFSLASFAALSQQSIKPSDELMKKITPLLSSQASSIRYFEAPADNIAIGVVTKGFDKRVYYTTPEGDYLLSGMMFDVANKTSFNNKITDQLKIVLPDSYIADLPNTTTITIGNGEKSLYAFVDVNCPYCHRLHKQIKELRANGGLQNTTVHYVLVGIMGSENKASTLLAQTDPETQYRLFDEAMSTKYVPADAKAELEGRSALNVNQTAYRNVRLAGGVPFLLGNIDGDWKISKGVPKPEFFVSFDKVAPTTGVETVAP
jgi:thiol:disulfide interchange protein DsbG